jgi:uncharacterized membrane protein (UPF0182 family)
MVILLTIQCLHLCWMILVYPLTLPFYTSMFWFGSIGYTSFKLSMVLSLKFRCNDHTSISFLN